MSSLVKPEKAAGGREGVGPGGGADRAARRATERLASPLGAEDCQVQSMPDASPVKWHLAHTTWFFETFVLVPHAPGYEPFHPSFSYLFNSYYNAVGDRLPRPRARPDDAADARGGLRLSRGRRSRDGERTSTSAGDALPDDVADVIELGHQSRAAASGIDPHRHQARARAEPAAARLSRRTPPTSRGAAPPVDWLDPFPGGLALDRPRRRRASPSTTKGRATASTSKPFQLASRPVDRTANTSRSSTTAATPGPSSGSPTAGTS